MKIKNLLDSQLSGSLNDGYYVAYYPHLGKSVIKRKPGKNKSKDWSDEKIKRTTRFGELSVFASRNLKNIISEIWNSYHPNCDNGYHQFMRNNKHAFNAIGEIVDYSLLQASIGDLQMPLNLRLFNQPKRDEYLLEWTSLNERTRQRESDILVIATLDKKRYFKMLYTNYTRKENRAIITLDKSDRECGCVYVFFANKQKFEFSNSIALSLK